MYTTAFNVDEAELCSSAGTRMIEAQFETGHQGLPRFLDSAKKVAAKRNAGKGAAFRNLHRGCYYRYLTQKLKIAVLSGRAVLHLNLARKPRPRLLRRSCPTKPPAAELL